VYERPSELLPFTIFAIWGIFNRIAKYTKAKPTILLIVWKKLGEMLFFFLKKDILGVFLLI
jgi:hypothetical protein